MNNSKPRIITDCAICIAMSVILTVMAVYVQAFWFITFFLCGAPIAYAAFKHGVMAGVISAACVIPALFAVIGNIPETLAAAALYILPSLVFSAIYRKSGERGFYFALFLTAAVYVAEFTLIAMGINRGGDGIRNMISSSAGVFEKSIKQSLAAAYGGDTSAFEKIFSDAVGMTIDLILEYLPSILICMAASAAYILIMSNIFILNRFRNTDIKYPPFCSLAGTRGMCFMTVVSYLVVLFADEKSIAGITAANAAAVLTAAFAVCGLSAIDFIFRYKVGSGFARAAIYAGVLIVGFPLASLIVDIVAFLGFFDAMNPVRSYIFFVGKGRDVRRNEIFKNIDNTDKNHKEKTDDSSDADSSDEHVNNERRQ